MLTETRLMANSMGWWPSQVNSRGVAFTLVIIVLAFISLLAGILVAKGFEISILSIAGGLAGIFVIYLCIAKPLTGYYLVILLAFFAFYPNRLFNRNIPLPTLCEALVLFLFLGTLISVKKENTIRNELFKTAASILLIVNVAYFLAEFFNPDMDSKAGWLFASKRYGVYLLMYYITYKLINTPARLRYFFKFWIGWAFIAACYGCYQQWVGLLPMEIEYLKNDLHEYGLLFQGGVIRKFSFLDGIVTFGILCGSTAVVSLIMAINEKVGKKRYKLFFVTGILLLGMVYSGARTTFIMLPCALALYGLITIRNRTTLVTLFVAFILGAILMFAPIYSPSINKIRSVFNSKDASMDVRTVNRHYIQPYIHKHPMGGGVNTAGLEGLRFNPGHPLAGFPPDSGLLKIALETGWVGLLLTMLFYLAAFYQGINYYFRIKSPEYKIYTISIIAALFSIVIPQFSQISIGQIPTAFFFYGIIALLKRLLEFDENELKTNLPVKKNENDSP